MSSNLTPSANSPEHARDSGRSGGAYEIGVSPDLIALSAVDWHAHEMIFGNGAAVIAGFLLTAIPKWTGRLPVAGFSLALLAALWAARRIAVFCSGAIGRPAADAIDALFLLSSPR